MLLTTLERYKIYYEITDTALDAQISMAIEQTSAEIESICNTVFDRVPADIEKACIVMVSMSLERRGSEHLKTEVIGPLRSDFADDIPDILNRYRLMPV